MTSTAASTIGRGASWFRKPLSKLDDPELDDRETLRIVSNIRAMLTDRGASWKAIADALERVGIETRFPAELEPDAAVNPTTLRLVLSRYRAAIGMAGEIQLSTIIGKLTCGTPLTEIDLASIRDIRGRARLARSVVS